MKITKKRKNIIITLICIALLICSISFIFSRPFGILTQGLRYIASHGETYGHSLSSIQEDIEFKIRMKDLSSNAGKVIYQKEDCRIEINDITRSADNYRISFKSYGEYSIDCAALISALAYNKMGTNTDDIYFNAMLTVHYDGDSYNCAVSGSSPMCYNNGDSFEFYIFSETGLNKSNIEIIDDIDELEFTISGLVKNEWRIKK